MSNKEKESLSAQVVLKPAGGKAALPPEKITAENIREMMPSAADVEKAQKYFSDRGFEVGAAFANSFSISGDTKLFEKTFETEIVKDERQAVKAQDKTRGKSSELPLGNLPKEIKTILEAATFTEPPDFGPGNV